MRTPYRLNIILCICTLLTLSCVEENDNVSASEMEGLRHIISSIRLNNTCGEFEERNYPIICQENGSSFCIEGALKVKDGIITIQDLIYKETFDGVKTLSKDATSMIIGNGNTNEIDFSNFTVARSIVGTHTWEAKSGTPCQVTIQTL